METVLVVVALSILGFGLVSGRVERSVITPPMAFVILGIAVGGWGLGIIPVQIETKAVDLLATVTLTLVLFTDASRIDLGLLRREHSLPIRLLGIGLPLTIGLGWLAAAFLLGHLTLWESALLAAILAPTDAALGQAVVNSPRVPVRIRQALNVESGLNDGLALPVVLIFLSLASGESNQDAVDWIWFALKQVTLGPIAGVSVALIGGRLLMLAQRARWMNHSFLDLSSLGLALLAYSSAELIGGNGFIAAFCAGLTLGNTCRGICQCLYEFAEAEGQLLTLLVFMAFGALMLPQSVQNFHWQYLLYALLSLTLIRVLPVGVSLWGERLKWSTIAFLGWFGPRGIASILYAMLLLDHHQLAGGETILSVVMTTVAISVFLHGLTAMPGAKVYAESIGQDPPDAAEHVEVGEMPTRLPPSKIAGSR